MAIVQSLLTAKGQFSSSEKEINGTKNVEFLKRLSSNSALFPWLNSHDLIPIA